MPQLLYVALTRFPSEKANSLQIAQNCEALAHVGYTVSLWVTTRGAVAAQQTYGNPFDHYGIDRNFTIERIPALDLYPLAGGNPLLERIAFYIHAFTFSLMLFLRLLRTEADIYYSRDPYAILTASLIKRRAQIAYEVHGFTASGLGGWLQRLTLRRAGHIIAITPVLRRDLIGQGGAHPEDVIVVHDGFREERFEELPDQQTARVALGWPQDAFIVGFVGRLQMLNNLDKGVGLLVEALSQCDDCYLALVGGPDEHVEQLLHRWQQNGQPEDHFLFAGQVSPPDVPSYLCAFDVCAMPHPFNQQFAYYTSPLKLFEYMAAGRAIVASDLPGWEDVVAHEQTALLVPPDDVHALVQAIQRLREDPSLREHLGLRARETALARYTWEARAHAIRTHLKRERS